MTTVEELTAADVQKLDDERGTSFSYGDRLFGSFTDDSIVSLAYDFDARDMATMLAADGNARKIERVLTLPVRGAAWHITGTGPAADLVKANLGPMLDRLIEQCTAAVVYRRSYFEKVWTTNADGRFVYEKLAWRPPASCSPRFDRKTGVEQGFNQRITDGSWWMATERTTDDEGGVPGQITIPRHKAFVYVHGRHREPVKGVSDLEVAYNAFSKKQKLRFLWAQYLENQSLPKIAVYGMDKGEAQRNAEFLAKARASGIVPMVRGADMPDPFAIIESSGRGADQFQKAIQYYDWEQTTSVLAGFTELASSANSGTGSYALSADQSEFFLASEQAFADDIAGQIVESVFAPLTVLNFGPDAEVPGLKIGPVGRRQTDRALSLVESIIVATRPNVPYEFTGFLLNEVAESLGLDTSQVRDAVTSWGERQQEEMEAAQAAQVAAAFQPLTMTNPPGQSPLAGLPEATQVADEAKPAPKVDAAPARIPSRRDRRRKAK